MGPKTLPFGLSIGFFSVILFVWIAESVPKIIDSLALDRTLGNIPKSLQNLTNCSKFIKFFESQYA